MLKFKTLFLVLFFPFLGFSQNAINVNIAFGGVSPHSDSILLTVESFVFDTGASISAITPQTYNNLKNINAVTPSYDTVLVENADGRTVQLNTTVITLLGLTPDAMFDNVSVIILPEGSTDNLLGLDIISNFNSVQIDFINQKILWE